MTHTTDMGVMLVYIAHIIMDTTVPKVNMVSLPKRSASLPIKGPVIMVEIPVNIKISGNSDSVIFMLLTRKALEKGINIKPPKDNKAVVEKPFK